MSPSDGGYGSQGTESEKTLAIGRVRAPEDVIFENLLCRKGKEVCSETDLNTRRVPGAIPGGPHATTGSSNHRAPRNHSGLRQQGKDQ